MTLQEARALVRKYARNAGDSSLYPDADVDDAILSAGNEFVNRTRCVTEKSAFQFSAAETTIDNFGITFVGWRSDRIGKIWIVDKTPIEIVDVDTIISNRAEGTVSAMPLQLGFSEPLTAEVYPTPDQTYDAYCLSYPFFTPFTPGAGSPGSIALNIPDDLIRPVLTYGAPYFLQMHQPEHQKWVATCKIEFEKHIARNLYKSAPRTRTITTNKNT